MNSTEDNKSALEIMIYDDDMTDLNLHHKLITKYLDERDFNYNITDITSQDDYSEYLKSKKPDIILLDILMPIQNGIDAARMLRKISKTSQIIFMTGSDSFAAEAFEVEALSYLKKPVKYESLVHVMDKAVQRINFSRSITVNSERISIRIFVNDIIFIETQGRKIVIHTMKGDVSTYMSLSSIQEKLPSTEFVQVSRFEIVALFRVNYINGNVITMRGGSELRISPKLKEKVLDAYELYRANHFN
ncbi:MAG: LytTR family DNA-binding domain-containing protein [Butyrivibrio sp.]|uniref:response regulator n=1 Tax=Butyrivibrio sp. TaxID=28121 RepID=UPI0025EBE6B6|nr:LytTR family DNA-binding domain-containing protein [Butyrivibrio sp.]MCR5773198.1 LytTR family DNA-binding domain-containing protein [Butyrivibrio sp.]